MSAKRATISLRQAVVKCWIKSASEPAVRGEYRRVVDGELILYPRTLLGCSSPFVYSACQIRMLHGARPCPLLVVSFHPQWLGMKRCRYDATDMTRLVGRMMPLPSLAEGRRGV